ncbi:MAG: kelch repeat-containing protein [Planctomycetota bacterium]
MNALPSTRSLSLLPTLITTTLTLLSMPAIGQIGPAHRTAQVGSPLPVVATIAYDRASNQIIGLDAGLNTVAWTVTPGNTGTNDWVQLAAGPLPFNLPTPMAARGIGAAATVIAFDLFFQDTWEFSTATNTWTNITATVGRPACAQASPTLATHPDGRVFLFTSTSCTGERLWVLNATAWQPVPVIGVQPPSRGGAGAAFLGNDLILFGGGTPGQVLGDTWRFTQATQTWTQVIPAGATPAPRRGAALASNTRDGNVVLASGTDLQSNPLRDAWIFDGTNWSQVTDSVTPVPSTFNASGVASGAYDVLRDEVIAVEFDDGSSPASTFVDSVVFTVGTKGLQDFGAQIDACSCPSTGQPMTLQFVGNGDVGSGFVPIWSTVGTGQAIVLVTSFSANNPQPIGAPGFANCIQVIDTFDNTLFMPSPAFIAIPNNNALIGLRLFYQAIGAGEACVSNGVEVRVGRP